MELITKQLFNLFSLALSHSFLLIVDIGHTLLMAGWRSFLSSPVSSTLDKPEEKATMSSPWWALLFGKLPLQVRAPGRGHRSVEKTKDHRMYLLLDVVRDTMGIFEHVGLVPKNGDKDLSEKRGHDLRFLCSSTSYLLHPGTEVVQGIWIDVSIGDELGQIKVLTAKRSEMIWR